MPCVIPTLAETTQIPSGEDILVLVQMIQSTLYGVFARVVISTDWVDREQATPVTPIAMCPELVWVNIMVHHILSVG